MKVKSTFLKATIFAAAIILSLVMAVSVMPAALAVGETGHGESLKASNISLSGDITMMYYFTGLDTNGYDAERDFVRVTVPKRNGGDPLVINTKIKDLATDTKSGTTRWIVPVSVAYAQQTDEFTIQFFKNNIGGKIRTRSVRDYADQVFVQIKNNDDYINLVTNMLNVGAMAQKAFDYKTGNLANKGLFSTGNPIDNMIDEHFYDVADRKAPVDSSPYIDFKGCSASLKNTVTLKIYVECPDSVTTATIHDGNKQNAKTVKIGVDEETGKKYVGVRNIAASAFNTRFVVTLACDGIEESYSYSVFDYAIAALNSPLTSPEEKDTARALYLFYTYTTKRVKPSYVPGPKDAQGNTACKHERTYTKKDGNIVCPDCGKSVTATKIDVAIDGTPTIIAGQDNKITLKFSISGNTVPLTGINFTPKCSGENVTFTLDEYTLDESVYSGDAENPWA